MGNGIGRQGRACNRASASHRNLGKRQAFSEFFAPVMADAEPKQFTATMAKSARKGRIVIDWLRNDRGSTAVAPFSVRAITKASVAVPVSWSELAKIQTTDQFGANATRERRWTDLVLLADAVLNSAVLKKLTAHYKL